MAKIPSAIPSFRQFMLRSQVLTLYRDMLRVIRRIEDQNQRRDMTQWVRAEFDRNRHHQDQQTIRMLISQGRVSLRELSTAIKITE
ncbi:LYR motif-containing protein 2 [Trichoplax sp. H2]|nr:LYR motif-containing protein 2 [Trichoplax sp. H2]|eukprot:RDD45400.1 LYR motif-containing protein 2 [Trichoplax sp. H2]